MNLEEAIKHTEQIIQKAMWMRGSKEEFTITHWGEGISEAVGFRVAELSGWESDGQGGGRGGSYMQVDVPNGLVVCATVERYVISLLEFEDDPDEILDDLWRLLYALTHDNKFSTKFINKIRNEII